MSAALVKPPSRRELERMSLADRVALEDVLGEAHEIVRGLNDAEIARLNEAGASQRAIAEACGRSRGWVENRLGALERYPSRRLASGSQAVPQNGDGPEIVDAEVVEPGVPIEPADYLPDVLAGTDNDLRAQVVEWCTHGRRVRGLLDDGALLTPKFDGDRESLLAGVRGMAGTIQLIEEVLLDA